jgi:hypothetical protein
LRDDTVTIFSSISQKTWIGNSRVAAMHRLAVRHIAYSGNFLTAMRTVVSKKVVPGFTQINAAHRECAAF